MPGFDGTGPAGAGPLTGGGRGFCAMPVGRGGSRPYGWRFFGRGRGRGYRHWYWATGIPGRMRAFYNYPPFGGWSYPYGPDLSTKDEIDMLKEHVRILEQQRDDIQNRINTLEKESDKEE